MRLWDYLVLLITFILMVGGFLLRRRAARRLLTHAEDVSKKGKRVKLLLTCLTMLGTWVFVVKIFALLFRRSAAKENVGFTVEIFSGRVAFFGYALSATVLTTWVIILIVLVLCLILRFTVFAHMKDNPKGIQLLLETLVDSLDRYVGSKVEGMSDSFGAYIFSLALLLVCSAATELLGLHAPTADITMTLGLSLITFFLINYYGFKRKGFYGRIKNIASVKTPDLPQDTPLEQKVKANLKAFAKPTTIVFPFRILSDIMVPVSLTCRLFGNMFGGMIIIDLLYYALGSAALGLPSIAGLFFNVFHPLIQAFIFITLTLSYIEEATAKETV